MNVVKIREARSKDLSDDLVASVPQDFWKAASCEVTKSLGAESWSLRAGNVVGVVSSKTVSGDFTLQIRPKLPEADVFFMADYAYGQRHEPLRVFDEQDILLESVRQDATACLLIWHALSINRFAARWLRRGYRSNVRTLDGKVKGRILVDRYVSHHLAVGDAARIPCRVLERTQDTPNNRILKAGLRYIATLSHTLPVSAARRAVLMKVNAALPRFAGVADIKVGASDIRAASTKGPQRHYAAVLGSTLELLGGRLFGEGLGAQSTSGFLWQMPALFQESVRGILDSTKDLVLVNDSKARARVHDSVNGLRRTTKVDPDLVIRTADGRHLILDTKYKDALPPASVDESEVVTVSDRLRVKISPSDIYQVVAYRQHDEWPNASSGLLYPVTLSEHEPLPGPMELRGFGEPVSLLFVDIGRYARNSLGTFLDSIRHHAAAEFPVAV